MWEEGARSRAQPSSSRWAPSPQLLPPPGRVHHVHAALRRPDHLSHPGPDAEGSHQRHRLPLHAQRESRLPAHPWAPRPCWSLDTGRACEGSACQPACGSGQRALGSFSLRPLLGGLSCPWPPGSCPHLGHPAWAPPPRGARLRASVCAGLGAGQAGCLAGRRGPSVLLLLPGLRGPHLLLQLQPCPVSASGVGPGGGGLLLQAPGARSLGLPVGPAARLEWGGRSPELRLRVSRIVGRGARGRQAGSQLKAFSGAVGSGCSWPPPPRALACVSISLPGPACPWPADGPRWAVPALWLLRRLCSSSVSTCLCPRACALRRGALGPRGGCRSNRLRSRFPAAAPVGCVGVLGPPHPRPRLSLSDVWVPATGEGVAAH